MVHDLPSHFNVQKMDIKRVGIWAGPVLFVLVALLPDGWGLGASARLTAGITMWLAVWWITEVVHPAVAALLPLVLFPMCGVMPMKATAAEYANEIIFLFMCGFFLGKAIERWQLHRRIALYMVLQMGEDPARVVLGFMLATGFISMWISNTATVVMMTPVAVAVAVRQPLQDHSGWSRQMFGKALLLGVGYAASIGGMATLVGTPTNAIYAGFMKQNTQVEVSFFEWFRVGFPLALVLLFVCWWMLIRLFPQAAASDDGHHDGKAMLETELHSLGPLAGPELRTLLIFGLIVLAWLTGSWSWYHWLPGCTDTTVVVVGAILLFLLPSGDAQRPTLLDWNTASTIPWGILVFFGGGLALAKGFEQSGLAAWLGQQLVRVEALPVLLVAGLVFVFVIVLSEVASNIATATMILPILSSLGPVLGINPAPLLMLATIAASAGFALPVANAANSVVYATGMMDTRDMLRAGLWLDLASIVLLLVAAYFTC
jgi:solute carrier family 13 (sodium-dependent dicarboxylate transporter), member 2/3/5